MRIRGRRRDADDGNLSLTISLQYFDYQPPAPPSSPTDVQAEASDGQLDEFSTSLHNRLATLSPRSSLPTAICRFCAEYEDADRGEEGQLSEIVEVRPVRPERSSSPESKRETEDGGFHSNAADAVNKQELPRADVSSDKDMLDSASDEHKKDEMYSGSEDHESKGTSETSNQGDSIAKRIKGRDKRSVSWRGATKTNYYRWTSDEVNQLVDAVATLGVGRWTELKSTYFPTSIRRPEHLKDKWRNLLIACGLQAGRKKKGDRLRFGDSLRDRIIALHEKHMLTKKRRTSAD